MTEKERRFAEEYVKDREPEAAAIRAGFTAKAATGAAAWIDAENPKKREVRALVDKLLGITPRDRRFIDEYLIDYNVQAAAVRAGYSPSTARNAAAWIHPEHPTKPEVKALLDEKIARMSRRLGISAERILKELIMVATANIDDIVDPDTGMLRRDITREDAAAVAEIRVSSKGNEVKLHNKFDAIKLICEMQGYFDKKLTLKGEAGAPPIVITGADRLED